MEVKEEICGEIRKSVNRSSASSPPLSYKGGKEILMVPESDPLSPERK